MNHFPYFFPFLGNLSPLYVSVSEPGLILILTLGMDSALNSILKGQWIYLCSLRHTESAPET